MGMSRSGKDGTYITRRVGKGPHVVKTIVTPAGSFRTMSKDVFDRALRSANTRLQRIDGDPIDARGDVRER